LLKDELRQFITDSIMYGHNTDFLTDDASFLESGVIDSTGVLELISYMETRFGITVEDHELVPENLDSINGLLRFVEKKGGTIPQASRVNA
jgi:acyl carrier protein